ncbi:hypothetical protein GCM10010982_00910 [Bowmanella pacifica]|uniref:Sulfotransferase domain-containing protein n=1 Tax=Bowmanella pacifica TaxID=502051 RepID=A0A917YQK8_9ALTE|nr:hypothetical protein GCM10010982_00910 [Bowmanella pacifica]
MNTFYLHVGPHKTGTTALQKFLLDNRGELFKNNLVYPKRYQNIFGHHPFRALLDEQRLTDEDIAFFNHEPHDFLLSSEDFISLNRDKFEYLRNTLDNKQVVIIYAWRRASYKLYSIWQETVKHGGTESFFAYYHDHLARPGQSQMLSADLKVAMFCHVFGKDNVKVLDYDASQRGRSLIPDFMNIIGMQYRDDMIQSNDNPDAVNRSMDIADIEVIRALNHVFKVNFGVTGSWVRNQYVKHLPELISIGLDELKAIVRSAERELRVGNYFVDSRCEQIMQNRFKDNLVNYQPNNELASIKVVSDEWSFSLPAQQLIGKIAHALRVADE